MLPEWSDAWDQDVDQDADDFESYILHHNSSQNIMSARIYSGSMPWMLNAPVLEPSQDFGVKV